jgi:hypothetical protein
MMTTRLLRHIPSGVLYAYQDVFAIRPDFEEVEDPNVIDVVATVVEPKKARAKKADPLPMVDDDALGIQAARGLP